MFDKDALLERPNSENPNHFTQHLLKKFGYPLQTGGAWRATCMEAREP
jgi:hypothetical protein